ncbi:MAG TPA: imidazole glycerol phosphate synthase subunit HisH [Ilumatobacteraceae bacterium]|jgi:glutamine amidotransferase|nr:imidazole glycerol phosphate synthase subunit HisH [Ilumatobacteraceae bacterium]
MSDQPLIAVLDYGIGNLRSAQKALQRCGADARLTVDHGLIADAHAVVLPGVGAFGACMAALRDADLEDAVEEAVDSGRPFLGICVGMQMLFDGSEEDDAAVGLGIIPGTIRWLGSELPRPQMQWNLLTLTMPDDPMFAGLSTAEAWVYFVHSLHGVPDDPEVIAATCTYGGVVNAAFRQGNVFATQFHPEKSGTWGVSMLGNFVRIAAEATVG